MKRVYFGTDGVRGVYGGPVMNDAFAWRLGHAAGTWLGQQGRKAPVVVLGRDTRFSGPALERSLAGGLATAGASPRTAGVVPTPAVSLAVRELRADLGVVITASHNPASDNGIKFFNGSGTKLDDAIEAELEALLPAAASAQEAGTGRAIEPEAIAVEQLYVDNLRRVLPDGALQGKRIVVDAANGAAYRTTPAVLRALGADVVVLSDQPDGRNINAGCGSQHPKAMQEKVMEIGALLGLAHDGDADRVILADEQGAEVDGDEILAILAGHALRAGRLQHRTLVATVQSNLGLKRFMEDAGGRLVRTAVGDRYVVEAMLAGGFNLGGESSGHIICTDISPCGDGLAAALLVLRAMLQDDRKLSDLRGVLTRYPQESRALRVPVKPPLETLSALSAAIRQCEAELAGEGRVLVRYSGTEPKIRFLVEGSEAAMVSRLMHKLVVALREDLPEN